MITSDTPGASRVIMVFGGGVPLLRDGNLG